MRQINLLPKELRSTRGGRTLEVFISLLKPYRELCLLLAFVVVLTGALGWQRGVLWNYRLGIQHLRKQIVRLQHTDADRKEEEKALEKRRAEFENEKSRISARLLELENVNSSETAVSAVLSDLVALIPDEIWIKELTLTDKALKISGSANDTKTVTAFTERLDQSKRFKHTQFGYTERASRAEGGDLNFEVSTVIAQVTPGSPV